jgi:membrane protein YqaA with SNARE-associated domain
MLRQVYNWVAGWSERPYGTWALFGLAFAKPCFFPMLPDALLIALYVGKPITSLLFPKHLQYWFSLGWHR